MPSPGSFERVVEVGGGVGRCILEVVDAAAMDIAVFGLTVKPSGLICVLLVSVGSVSINVPSS